MKFRIVEQRGVFRIQSHRSYRNHVTTTVKRRRGFREPEYTEQYETVDEWYFCAKRGDEEFTPNDSRYVGSRVAVWGAGGYPSNLGSVPSSMVVNIYEFDTYKKAENYIKKFYGSTGVDAIEKPAWKTV